MVDVRISDMNAVAAGTLADGTLLEISAGGVTYSMSLATLKTFLGATLAALASPTFTGAPTAPTAAAGDNSTSIATTAFVATAVAALVNASPAALDTLKELADAIGDDANYAAHMTTALAAKAPLASPAFTGTPTTAATPAAGDNSLKLATTAYADAAALVEKNRATTAEGLLAPKASPAFTGTPTTAATPAAGDNSLKLATTGYADRAVGTETARAQTAEGLLAPKASPAFTGTATFAARPILNGATPWDSANLSAPSMTTGQNGYAVLPGGLIVQWGTATPNSDTTIAFPLTFPNGCFSVQINVAIGAGNGNLYTTTADTFSKTGFACRPRLYSGGNQVGAQVSVVWIAVGY